MLLVNFMWWLLLVNIVSNAKMIISNYSHEYSKYNNILIYHVLRYWKEFSSIDMDMELSDNTHECQFIPETLFTRLLFKYNHGLF